MQRGAWIEEYPAAITVCDQWGVIVEMNDEAAVMFRNDGGRELIGKNILDCHPEPSRKIVEEMLEKHTSKFYTIEKDGIEKLVCQTPWMMEGQFRGIVEFVFEIKLPLPHFLRAPSKT